MAKSKRRSGGRRLAPMLFGGVGLYCHRLFFGIMAVDVMYLKDVNAQVRT